MSQPLVGVIMGSRSDWEVMKHACDTLRELDVECETRVVSAHRTPDAATEYARTAAERGLRLVIAGAGGAAHLAGVMAGNTHLPVLGVPMQTSALGGMDSLLSTVQMPAGIPVGTLAIGKAGAINAALLAAAILAGRHPRIARAVREYRSAQTARLLRDTDPRKAPRNSPARRRRPAR
jgi:5-(carboxyamino)imidazole ribonucleotide mutase